MKNIMMILVVVVIAGASFFGGMQYGKSQVSSQSPSENRQYVQNGQVQNGRGTGFGNRRNGGGATMGQVVSQDANSITLKLPDGSSKIINLSETTMVTKTQVVSKSDIQTGMTIAVFGMSNSDGSVTAQSIQLNPQMRRGGTGGRPSDTQAPNQQ